MRCHFDKDPPSPGTPVLSGWREIDVIWSVEGGVGGGKPRVA